jgi:hypothetical protein
MALTFDGLKLLKTIAANPPVFQAVMANAEKAALSLVVGQLKAKTSGLDSLRDVRRALGDEFVLVVEAMSDAEIKSLITKIDKYNLELQTAAANPQRRHLSALASGLVEPVAKPGKSGKTEAPESKAPSKSDRLSSTAMAAVRKRRRS